MSLWLKDLQYGLRLLLRAPGFAAIAIGALAIGIGANTAIFSVVNTLLIQQLPYVDPDRLVLVWEHNIPRDRRNNVVSPGNFIHWREMQQSFEDMAAASGTLGLNFTVTLTGDSEPEEVPVQLVSASFFRLLGVSPVLGRAFAASEEKPDARVAIIGERLWRRRFGADPGILMRPVVVDGNPYSIVGIMPAGFALLDKSIEVWLPLGFTAQSRTPRGRWLSVVARLKPGVTVERAQQDMTRVHAELTRQFPEFNTGWTARVVPIKEELTATVRPALLILLGAVGFVLLIACANVANLLLARATSRQRELAVRAALGAGRGRLLRQMLAESLVIAAAGGISGLLLAMWSLHLLRTIVAEQLPIQRLDAVTMDGWVFAFTALASLASGLIFGLVPALGASRSVLVNALKDGGRSGSAARGNRTRAAFVVVEVALALVLLAGAGLLVRSFARLISVNPGFDPARTVTMDLALPSARYREPQQRAEFYRRLFERVGSVAGVEKAGAVSFLPLAGLGAATSYEVVGQPPPPLGQEPVADVRVVTSDYFEALRIPLVRGRLFNESDPAEAANRVIVNEALAQRHWPGEDPIGKRIRISWNDNREDEVIGVVGDVRHAGLETEPRATTYWPHARFPYNTMTIAVRTRAEGISIANPIVALVREQDPALAVSDIRTMEQVVSESVAQRRLTMMMLAIFAVSAVVLAAVGIYGVIAYSVTQRTQEIGIRMALGAQRGDVLRMVVGYALLLTGIGVVCGAVAALLLTRLMEGLLYDVKPGDPLTFVAVAAFLSAVAAAAGYVPGRRATRVDPVIALRAE
jgi:putative ABC transport system permease protein